MNRIVEAFTRPHYQVTAMDELVQAVVVIVMIVAAIGLFSLFTWIMFGRNK